MLEWTRNLFRLRDRAHEHEAVSSIAAALHAPPPPTSLMMPAPPGVGEHLNRRYRVDAMIGQGSTGIVFRARDLAHGDDVAVKLLLRRHADRSCAPADEAADDAAPALRLTHPNITRVFQLARHGRWPYLVMEHVAGVDLYRHAKKHRRRRLPLGSILRVGTSCLDALSYAHTAGVLHNDVKPSNLILTRAGTVKLCDFGLSRLAEDSPGAWLSATSSGAPAFMSPERIRGDPCGPRSDLYSVAATLYTLTAGRTLFGAEMAQAWRGHLELEPQPTPDVPMPLFHVLRRALAKDPARRFESAAEMHAALVQAFSEIDDDDADWERDERQPAPQRFPPPSRLHTQRTMELAQAAYMPPPSAQPVLVLPRRVPEGMIRIPRTRLASRHGGVHDVGTFFLHKTPVTNADYKRFVDETGEQPPPHWLAGRVAPPYGAHPVVGVSLGAAARYASWAGLCLPSDLEWETAARGERAFPWGDAYEARRVNGPEQSRNDTVPVTSLRDGASPFGCLDMVGNVWEWTDPARSLHTPDPGYAWVFGGSFRHPCAQDGGIPRSAVSVDKEYLYLGFRCARDDEP